MALRANDTPIDTAKPVSPAKPPAIATAATSASIDEESAAVTTTGPCVLMV